MGKPGHLSAELLSVYADGEATLLEQREVREHLAGCPRCEATGARFSRLDAALAAPALLTCAAVLPLLSAQLDSETSAPEAAVAIAHLTGCPGCRAARTRWSQADGAVALLPSGVPSPRVDAAIAGLGRTAPPGNWGSGLRGRAPRLVLRGASVALAALLVALLAGLPRGAGLPLRGATEAPGEVILVAGIQQVLNTRTNTLFILQPADRTVLVRDATTEAVRATIALGGRPLAIAINEDANQVYVIDADRTLTQIDGARNAVVSTTAVNLAGVPTALKVDAANGQIVVAAAKPLGASQVNGTNATNGASSAAATSAMTGEVAILDLASKRALEVRTVSVVAQQVILDSTGTRALLVSREATTLASTSTYAAIERLPGGVAAAFGTRGAVAVLSPAANGARLSFHATDGAAAAAALELAGVPFALTALPDGGFAALIEVGGRGQIVTVGADGKAGRTIEIGTGSGRELSFDPRTRRFAVVGDAVAFASLAADPVAAAAPSESPPATATPSPTPRADAARPSPTPSAEPRPSAAPAVAVPAGATLAWESTYRLALPGGRQATAIGGGGRQLWLVDQDRWVHTLDTASGATAPVAQLPSGANVDTIVVGTSYVYLVDRSAARVYALSRSAHQVDVATLGTLRTAVAVTVTPDDTFWFATPASGQLVGYDPRTRRLRAVETGLAGIAALTADIAGRVWYADALTTVGSYDSRSGQRTDIRVGRASPATGLTVDGRGRVWLTTAAGELVAIADGTLSLAARADRPVIGTAVAPDDRLWYFAGSPGGVSYGPADGSVARQLGPSGVRTGLFDAAGRLWLLDGPSGSFYISISGATK